MFACIYVGGVSITRRLKHAFHATYLPTNQCIVATFQPIKIPRSTKLKYVQVKK